MKILRPLLLLSLLVSLHALGQQTILQLRTGPVAVEPIDRSQAAELFVAQSDVYQGRLTRCVIFNHTLSRVERDRLEAMGLVLLAPLRPHAWVLSLDPAMDATVLVDHGAIATHTLQGTDKLDLRAARHMAENREGNVDLVVVPWKHQRTGFMELVQGIARNGEPFGERGAVHVRVTQQKLERLLDHPAVQWIELMPEPGKPEDLRGRAFHRVNTLGPALPDGTGLDGTGVTVVVNDDGFVGPHVDFKGRTEQSDVAADLVGDHGDMVAGIIAGAGNIDPRATGMAPAADLIIRQYQGEMPNTVDLHQNAGAMIFNSSYSNGCNAGYTVTTQLVDDEIHANPALIQVFSAGNDGALNCDYGAGEGWGNITGGHKIGKNVIATANLTDVDGLVNSSSRGPSADGRIKPDISAFGNGQMSNASNNAYMTGSGTSAASPGIAGVMALLYQGWRAQHGVDPTSGLMKAFMLNTADDLGNVGPDYRYGWGAVNGARAMQAITENRWTSVLVEDDAVQTVQIDVPAGLAALRVMAYWTDPAGELLAANALVNDIDLSGVDPIGNGHLPWLLSTLPDPVELNAPAIRNVDHLNNVEQIIVNDPVAGTWNFPLYGFDVPLGPQEVFVVYEFIQKGIAITWPLDGERLPADATSRFRWDTPDRSTPVTVSYSINGGSSWSDFTVPGTQRHFDLGLGTAAFTDIRLRVTQGSSTDLTQFTAMPTPMLLSVPVNCVDSALLQWPSVAVASSYIVHRLGERYMMNVDTITETSYWFTGLSAVHNDWFAVTAIGPQDIIGQRSIAVARPQQLVACLAGQDLEVTEVLAPVGPLIPCQPQVALQVMVHNAGSQSVDGFTVGVRNAVGVDVNTVFTNSIAPGEFLPVELSGVSLGIAPGLTAALRVWAASDTEDNPVNDTLTFSFTTLDITAQFPINFDMEAFVNCTEQAICDVPCSIGPGLTNAINGIADQLDWRVDTAGTASGGTGPSVDHTFGTAEGHYLYMEATGSCAGGEAHVLTSCFTVPTGDAYGLNYSYHMYGTGMGSLHVDLLVNGEWLIDVIPAVEGDQGDTWLPGFVFLSSYAGSTVNVRFRGIRGSTHLSDMALDDIRIDQLVGIGEIDPENALIVRQTSTPGQFMAQLPGKGTGVLLVHDALGRSIAHRTVAASPSVTIDLVKAAPGVYSIMWINGIDRMSTRLLKP